MGDYIEELNILENKHKKEKKEVQAQIQALKKIAKNDKSKKKELANEIVKLESELEARHKQELEQVQGSNNEEIVGEPGAELDKEIGKVKISKAQKRRDKKSQQEKERNEQIKLQEEENVHGLRNTETLAITAKLKEKKLKMFLIPSDGDCLYKAVAHQLEMTGRQAYSIDELRQQVADYIRINKEDFIPFMTNPATNDTLTDSEFDNYCQKVETTKTWGGQLEIRALSNCLKCPIHVIQSTGLGCIEQGTDFHGQPLIITYHRHMYQLGAHYNSTQVIDNSTEED